MIAAFHVRGLQCFLFLSLLHLVSSRKFKRKTEFDGYMCNTEDIVFKRNVSSAVNCAISCLRSQKCLDIYHVPETKLCIGCKVWYSTTNEIREIMAGSKCYEKSKVCPDGTLRKRGRSCYIKTTKQQMNFWDSKSYCSEMGAHVVQPETAEENAYMQIFFENLSNAEILWIGFSDWKNEGQWRWQSSGDLAFFKDWAKDEPNGFLVENCAGFIKNRHNWFDFNCLRMDTLTICEKRIEE